MKPLLILIVCCLLFTQLHSQVQKSFVLRNKISVSIREINRFEKLEIRTSVDTAIQVIDDLYQSEKDMFLELNDYNFDGFTDFSCYSLDEGMGVYSIYQIYLYNKKHNKFERLKIPENINPNCVEFCDIKPDEKRRRLLSSCRGGAKWHQDTWTFNQKGELVLLK